MTACHECPVASFCPMAGLSAPTPCPGGTHSNATGLVTELSCVSVVAGEWAPTGSQFPEACPASGFTCPGRSDDDVNAVESSFDWLNQYSSWHGDIPIVLGEFGCSHDQPDYDGRVRMYDVYVEMARKYDLVPVVWDDDGDYGVYDRNAGTWDEDVRSALVD